MLVELGFKHYGQRDLSEDGTLSEALRGDEKPVIGYTQMRAFQKVGKWKDP